MIAKPQSTTETHVGWAETHEKAMGNTRANASRPMICMSAKSLYFHGATLCSYHSPLSAAERTRVVQRSRIVYTRVPLNSRQLALTVPLQTHHCPTRTNPQPENARILLVISQVPKLVCPTCLLGRQKS